MSRTINNTNYSVQTDVVTTESGLVIEEGTLHTYDGELKAHLGGEIVSVKGKQAVVNISSAQILAMGSTPIELLPAAGVNQWYDVDKIILIMNRVGTAYTTTEPALYTTGAYFAFENILTNIDNHSKSNSYGTQSVVGDTTYQASEGLGLPLGNGLHLTTWGGTNPTDGTCTMTAIVTYTTRTFGA